MTYECLKAPDGRKKGLIADWQRWLKSADEFYDRFFEEIGESPFCFHEVASVGFLASSAAIAGFIPMNEYDVIKRGRTDKRTKVAGRADLWFSAGERCYSFEFKRALLSATPSNLLSRLKITHDDVKCVDSEEYHYAAGCLLARVADESKIENYEQFAKHEFVDAAYHIGPPGLDGAYLFFVFKE